MDSTLKRALYVVACLVVPMVWGIGVVHVSNAVERRLRNKNDREIPPIEFHI